MSEDWPDRPGHHLITRGDEDYPELLEQIQGPPQQLYVNGSPDVLHLPAIAIVGSRNPTQGGIRNAFEFARHLGSRGFCIVSGLAQGIGLVSMFPAKVRLCAAKMAIGGGLFIYGTQ